MDPLVLLANLIEANRLTPQRKEPLVLRDLGNWAFPLPDHFLGAIGVEEDPNKVLVQGTLFQFATGDIIHDHASGYTEPWGKFPWQVKRSVQVVDATPVSASSKLESSGSNKRIPRHPGRVQFDVVHWSENGRAVATTHHRSTQDEFVSFLINGILDQIGLTRA